MTPVLWALVPSNEEINVGYWETYQISPKQNVWMRHMMCLLVECLDPPLNCISQRFDSLFSRSNAHNTNCFPSLVVFDFKVSCTGAIGVRSRASSSLNWS